MCLQLHALAHTLRRYDFPFAAGDIPADGIYLLFERGEHGHGGVRIVRVGTHRGEGQLPGRLKEHFVNENKDRSIFRKNVGRAILHRADDSYLRVWNIDTLSRAARERHAADIDRDHRRRIEAQVTEYIQENLSFVVIPVPLTEDRLRLEERLVGTVSLCSACRPSPNWFGKQSPKPKIRESGLWQEQHLYKEPLTAYDLAQLRQALRR
jgi:hypothetical protein